MDVYTNQIIYQDFSISGEDDNISDYYKPHKNHENVLDKHNIKEIIKI